MIKEKNKSDRLICIQTLQTTKIPPTFWLIPFGRMQKYVLFILFPSFISSSLSLKHCVQGSYRATHEIFNNE